MAIFKALVIVLSGLLVYAPAFHGDWLWDDDESIYNNALLRQPMAWLTTWAGEASGRDYFPLTTVARWIQWQFFQNTVTGYHLVSVGLHLIAALLFWRVLWRLGIGLPWIGGLLFAIHPIQVESVAWISELKNTLSMPFLLLSFLAWLKFDENKKRSAYWWAVGLYVLAISAKSSVVMYPFVLLLYAWWKRNRITFIDLKRSIPFFVVSLAFGIATIVFQHGRAIGIEVIPNTELPSRIAVAGMSIPFYLWKCFFPIHLLPIYPRWSVDPPSLIQFLAWPLLAAVLIWMWSNRKTWGRNVLFGFGVFLLTLLPVLGFITMSYMRITWTADHFLYLPVTGLIGLCTAGIAKVYQRSGPDRQRILVIAGICLLAFGIIGSHRYAGRFAGEENLWSYTLQYNPNAWQAHSRYGAKLLGKGDVEGAALHIEAAYRLRPDLAETNNNYANVLESKGDAQAALPLRRKAAEAASNIPLFQALLAKSLVQTGNLIEGRDLYESLLKASPSDPTFLCNYGVALYRLGRKDEAISYFEKALKIDPNLKDAKTSLEVALKEKGGSETKDIPGSSASQ